MTRVQTISCFSQLLLIREEEKCYSDTVYRPNRRYILPARQRPYRRTYFSHQPQCDILRAFQYYHDKYRSTYHQNEAGKMHIVEG